MPLATTTRQGTIGLLACALAVALITASAVHAADETPDEVRIDSISDLYRPVTFDHQLHADLAESCALCHHHATGAAPLRKPCLRCHQGGKEAWTVSCSACHPAEPFSSHHLAEIRNDPLLYHTHTPGLKGAYHQLCLGCHREVGASIGCQDCHARNEKGNAYFHAEVTAKAEKTPSGH